MPNVPTCSTSRSGSTGNELGARDPKEAINSRKVDRSLRGKKHAGCGSAAPWPPTRAGANHHACCGGGKPPGPAVPPTSREWRALGRARMQWGRSARSQIKQKGAGPPKPQAHTPDRQRGFHRLRWRTSGTHSEHSGPYKKMTFKLQTSGRRHAQKWLRTHAGQPCKIAPKHKHDDARKSQSASRQAHASRQQLYLMRGNQV